MPTAGLSLFGFFERELAVRYLKSLCHPPNMGEQAARIQWNIANPRVRTPFPNAGHPDIQPIPQEHDTYLTGVQSNPRYPQTVRTMPRSFRLVEIDRLLSFQVHVDLQRATQCCASLRNNPQIQDMLPICLPHRPLDPNSIPHTFTQQAKGFVIESPNLNFQIIAEDVRGDSPDQLLEIRGVGVGESSSLIQVALLNGRYYLRNGYHRAYCLRQKGATHMPCLVLEANNFSEVDQRPGPYNFRQRKLESQNPPTLGHFTQGLAHNVTLRNVKRVIRVSWSDDVLSY
jgi:hypothetical protein